LSEQYHIIMSILSKLKLKKEANTRQEKIDQKSVGLDLETKKQESKKTIKPEIKKAKTSETAKKSVTKVDKKDTKHYPFAHQILKRPLLTEKVTYQGQYNQYSFEVAKSTNKIEIQKAIQGVYGVNPISINVINIKGKEVRRGRQRGRTKDWKKAIVTLKAGDKIEVYEGV